MNKFLLTLILVIIPFIIIADTTTVILDSLTTNSFIVPTTTIQWISIIASSILLLLSIFLGNKITKYKIILSQIKILFSDIEDSVIDNRISSKELKKILEDIETIKREFIK